MPIDFYQVLVKADAQNRIVDVNSSAFVNDPENWLEIDSGNSYRHRHAQCNYFGNRIVDMRGVYRYAYVPGAADGDPKWRERTDAELAADAPPPASPSESERLAALEEAMLGVLMGGEAGV